MKNGVPLDKSPARGEQKSARDTLFTTAVTMFAELGYENVTIRKICEQAGLSIGTFYNNFESKGAIVLELLNGSETALKAVPDDPDMLFADEVIALVRSQAASVIAFQNEFGSFRNILFSLLAENRYQAFIEEHGLFFRLVNAVMKAQYLGEVRRDIEPQDISRKILRLSAGLVFDWCLKDCSYDLDEMLEQELTFYLDLLRFDPETSNDLDLALPPLR